MCDFESSPDQRRAVLHRPKSETRGAVARIAHPFAVISDLEADVLALHVETDLDAVRLGVFERIR